MKNYIIIFLSLFIVISASAQSTTTPEMQNINTQIQYLKNQVSSLESRQQEAGMQLRKYYKIQNIGGGLAFTGMGAAAVGALFIGDETVNVGPPLIWGGLVLGLVGAIISTTAHSKIDNAGIILSGNGVGVRL